MLTSALVIWLQLSQLIHAPLGYNTENVFVINEWWKSNLEGMWERQPKNAPSNIVPDVIVFHYDNVDNELLVCKKMKRL